MLITVSGPVGSGKSTLVEDTLGWLGARGRERTYWKFRTLPCFTWLHGDKEPRDSPVASGPGRRRWSGYAPRRMGALTTLGQLARIVAFRCYRRFRGEPGVIVCNRYFYDSFVHFDVTSKRSRLLVDLLTRAVPQPDLAFLLVASPEVVAARRPTYAEAYVVATCRAYAGLPQRFPALIEVSGEDRAAARETVQAVLERALAGEAGRGRSQAGAVDREREKA